VLKNLPFSASIRFIIAFQIIFQPLAIELGKRSYAQAAPVPTTQNSSVKNDPTPEQVKQAVADAVVDPAISDILNDKTFPLGLKLNPSDPVVDQDPFFLKSQSWARQVHPQVSEDIGAAFSRDNNSVSVSFAGLEKVWQLNAPMHPIFKTDEFIFFAVNTGSDLFARVQSEGLFFISYNQLVSASVKGDSVLIHFLPMPRSGWVTTKNQEIIITGIPNRDIIAVTNTEGLTLPIRLKDVRSMAKVQNFNLMLAMSMTLDDLLSKLDESSAPKVEQARERLFSTLQKIAKTSQAHNEQAFNSTVGNFGGDLNSLISEITNNVGHKSLMIPRGSTAGFGLLFTGFDLDHPTRPPYYKTAAQTEHSSFKIARVVLNIFGLNSAQAMPPDLAEAFQDIGVVIAKCAGIYAVSYIAQVTILRDKIERKMREGAAIGKNQKQVSVTVLAQSLASLYQVPYNWPTHVLEFIIDSAGVRENGLARKIFNNTFGFARRTNVATPVNDKSFYSGFGILGVVDTAFVGFQVWLFWPYVLTHVVSHMGPFFATRVAAAMHDHESLALYALISVVSNFSGYLMAGANMLASQVQEIATKESLPIVATEMRESSLNPNDPKNKAEFDKRVKDRVRAVMTRQGMPADNALLFDANSLFRSIQEFLGYEAPEKTAGASDNYSPEEFYSITRQGLNQKALNNAYQFAVMSGNAAAAKILKDALNDFSLLRKFVSKPLLFMTPTGLVQVARAYKEVRRELTSFTMLGDINSIGLPLSESWLDAKPRGEDFKALGLSKPAVTTEVKVATEDAALIFRRAFFTLLHLHENTIEDSVVEYDPLLAESGYARTQLRRAFSRANQKFISETGADFTDLYSSNVSATNGDDLFSKWTSIYRKELLRESGLRIEYSRPETIKLVDSKTAEVYQLRLSNDAKLAAYLAAVQSPLEKLRIEQTIKNDIFVSNYVDIVINGESVPALDVSQPGQFQSIRQMQWVRNSKVSTGFIRLTEGLFSNSHYVRGRAALLARLLPFVKDAGMGNLRELQKAPVEASFRWLYMHRLWNAVLPWKDWRVNQVLRGSTVSGPWATVQRMLSNVGMKPGSEVTGMLAYGTIGTWATSFGMPLYFLFKGDIKNGFNYVDDKVVHGATAVINAVTSCSLALGQTGSEVLHYLIGN
jgi:hypothetical protein